MATFSVHAMDYFVLDQLTFYYSNSEFLRCVVQSAKKSTTVIGAAVIKFGISNGDFGGLISVLESKVILIVDHLAESPVIPAMASDVKGLIV